MPTEPDSNPIAALLSVWETEREGGRTITPEDLCRGRPDLLPAVAAQIRLLRAFDRGFDADANVHPATPTSSSLSLPVVPGYELLGELGRGGMGVVYRARQVALNRHVALKMILIGERAGPTAVARFRDEASAAAGLRHPHIVQVYELSEAGGLQYFALEYCPAGCLADQLDGTPWPAERAASFLRPLADAVHHAHTQGVVHRDLKPANVLLATDPAGREPIPKVCDFGLAKRMDAGSDGPTQTGDVVGTPSYMAPEQARGDRSVGPPADVYALGAILYQLLTGRPPFRTASVYETLRQVTDEEPAGPRRINPAIPRDLETVCLKCLEKDPRKRYASAATFAEDLTRFLCGRPVLARPVGAAGRLWRWARRNPALAGAAFVATVAMMAVVALGMAFTVSQAQARREAKELLARAALDRGRGLAERGDVDVGLLWMARALEEAPSDHPDLPRLIRAEIAGWSASQLQLRHVLEHPRGVTAIGFSPDGSTVATGGGTEIRLWEPATGRPVRTPLADPLKTRLVAETGLSMDEQLRFVGEGRTLLSWNMFARRWDTSTGEPVGQPLRHGRWPVQTVATSPDGRTVATGTGRGLAGGEGGEVGVWDVTTDRLIAANPAGGSVHCIAVSTDGRVVVSGDDAGVRRWAADTADAIGKPLSTPHPVRSLATSRDGRTLLTGTGDLFHRNGEGRLWDLPAGTPRGEPLVRGAVQHVAFTPDGSRCALADALGTARLFVTESGQPVGEPIRHVGPIEALSYAPDGRWLFTGGQDGTARVWDASNGRPIGGPLWHGAGVSAVAFSPDGRGLATAASDGAARVWQFDQPVAMPHAGRVRVVAFSPDGLRVATGGEDRTARVWDAATGRPVGPPLSHTNTLAAVAFRAEGRAVLTAGGTAARQWDAVSGEPVGEPMDHAGLVNAAVYSPDSRRVLTGGEDRTARVWDAATGKPIGLPLTHPGPVSAVAWVGRGQQVATTSRDPNMGFTGPGVAHLWNTETGVPVGSPHLHPGPLNGLAVSPDGTWFATACSDGAVRLFKTDSGVLLAQPLQLGEAVTGVTFSPDGRLVAAGGNTRSVRVWEVASGRQVGPILNHPGGVAAINFSPDGRWLLTVGSSGDGRVWDVATGRPVGPPLGNPGHVFAATFSPNGKTVATAVGDGSARVWPGPGGVEGAPARVAAWVRVITGRELAAGEAVKTLTPGEWAAASRELERLGGPPPR